MVRPVRFGYNTETAKNNYYQQQLRGRPKEIQQRALEEFDGFASRLEEAGVQVITIDDIAENNTPDAIFPNNWISFHEDGTVVTYPMWAINRRKERRADILEKLTQEYGLAVHKKVDYSQFEQEEKFLEGTGSMVLDRQHQVAYACVSPRTHRELLARFCKEFGYEAEIFTASQTVGDNLADIYHTNVMMSVGENIAVLCAEAIRDEKEQESVIKRLRDTHKEVIFITENQANRFVGNMLQVVSKDGEKILVMSTRAYESLNQDQIRQLSLHTTILHSSLNTIEACGGGSARCMMAEVFLPENNIDG